MTEFRVGDFARLKSDHSARGVVIEASGQWVQIRDGIYFYRYAAAYFDHAAPDPLPERLPVGTVSLGGATLKRFDKRGDTDCIRYWGNWDTNGEEFDPSWCDPDSIHWPSYHAALHAEQDATALSPEERLARTVACSLCLAAIGVPCRLLQARQEAGFTVSWSDPSQPFHGHRLEAAKRAQGKADPLGYESSQFKKLIDRDRAQEKERYAGSAKMLEGEWRAEPYLPRAGELVRVIWLPNPGDDEIGELVVVSLAFPSEDGDHIELTGSSPDKQFGHPRRSYKQAYCRVEPVEKDSNSCRDPEKSASPGARREPCENRRDRSPSGGDSGTGQAAGPASGNAPASAIVSPAASSGFQAPKHVLDVECPACGAKSQREFPSWSKTWCRDSERRQLHDGNGNAAYHQLRIDRFEATRERPKFPRPKPAPRKACSVPGCGHLVEHRRSGGGVAVPNDAPPEMIAAALRETQANQMCGDHAELHMRAPKVAILRSDLDRPLPRALVTWPEAWSSSSSESDH